GLKDHIRCALIGSRRSPIRGLPACFRATPEGRGRDPGEGGRQDQPEELAMNERVTIRPVSTAVGAEILDVDLAGSLSDSAVATIRRALFEHGVVFFRDQKLTPEQHVAFAERFGEININRFFKAVDGYPMIAEVRKEPEQKGNIGGGWHTDHSYDV